MSELPIACSTRAPIRTSTLHATAARSDAAANSPRPQRNAGLRPQRSPSLPASSSSAANVMLYAVNTHDSVDAGSAKLSEIPGSATLTIVTSIATRKIDTDVMNSVAQARRSTRSSNVCIDAPRHSSPRPAAEGSEPVQRHPMRPRAVSRRSRAPPT